MLCLMRMYQEVLAPDLFQTEIAGDIVFKLKGDIIGPKRDEQRERKVGRSFI